MSWLKCIPVFKHGYGSPEYRELREGSDLEDIKEQMQGDHGDPEGIRACRFEIIEALPRNELLARIESARGRAIAASQTAARLLEQLNHHYPNES